MPDPSTQNPPESASLQRARERRRREQAARAASAPRALGTVGFSLTWPQRRARPQADSAAGRVGAASSAVAVGVGAGAEATAPTSTTPLAKRPLPRDMARAGIPEGRVNTRAQRLPPREFCGCARRGAT